jgi:hypothetical protein
MTASRHRYYLAPVTDPADRYAAGQDGNAFHTKREAMSAARSLQRLGDEWNTPWSVVHLGGGRHPQVACTVPALERKGADA